jgi:hypothetical protein
MSAPAFRVKSGTRGRVIAPLQTENTLAKMMPMGAKTALFESLCENEYPCSTFRVFSRFSSS